jgi:Na+/phosphate symporter
MNKISAKDVKIGIKETLMVLHEMGSNAEECISSIQTAFIYHKTLPLEESKAIAESIKKQEVLLTTRITEIIGDDPGAERYVTIPGHLSRIAEDIEKFIDCVDKKIRENILFSDRAVNESVFLLQRLVEILRPTTDMILARNIFLSEYVQKSQSDLSKMADEYATLHEERLIKGVCLPPASSLYISMLDHIKQIAWHAKQIAVKLSE